jgi:hypothetical protein
MKKENFDKVLKKEERLILTYPKYLLIKNNVKLKKLLNKNSYKVW